MENSRQTEAESIISNFKKKSDFNWLQSIEKAGLEVVELVNNNWIKLNFWKTEMLEFHKPIILYKKDESGIFIPDKIGLIKI